MRVTAALIVVVGVAGGEAAYPQQGTMPSLSPTPFREAPVGHRQPRPSDIPSDRATTDMAPTGSVTAPRPDTNDPDVQLNRALRGVYRDC